MKARAALPIVLAAAGMLGAWTGLDRLRSLPPATKQKDLLYLPSGAYLRAASLGHAPLAADLVYLWSIQFYSDYSRSDRHRYVRHIYGDVIPELDPHYLDPYTIGSMILAVEARDLEGALQILELGMERNPDEWILPYLAGWECYRAGLYERAVAYMDRAGKVPGAPVQILRNRAGFVARSGDLREAYELWRELYEDPDSDANTRAVAERKMRDLHVRIHVSDLTRAIEEFRRREGRAPSRLDELVQRGIVPRLPLDPDGNPYSYDRGTGTVTTATGRVLGSS